MKKAIFFLFIFLNFLIFFLKIKLIFANNLLKNPDFESESQDWKTNNSSVNFSLFKEDFFDGSTSAKISNPKTSSYGIEQTLTDISSTLNYKISGWVKLINPFPEKAFIRIAWYKSIDGSGSQFSTDDSPLATNSSFWQKIEIIKTPPEGINSAKIRLLVTTGSALFDQITFEEYLNPPTPTPTQSPINSPTLTPFETPTQTIIPTPTLSLISYEKVYLSEIYPNPQTGEKEWVELYNDNDFDVFLNQWYLDDLENAGSSPRPFNFNIQAKTYGVFELSSAIFNNDGDTIRLLDFNKQLKDSFEYQTSEKGKSWARANFNDGIWCLQEPSKNQPNKDYPKPQITTIDQEEKTITPTSFTISSINKQTSVISFNKNFSRKKINIFQKQTLKTFSQKNSDYGEVLGISIKKSQKDSFLLTKTLLLISLNYSFILLLILIYRLKKSLRFSKII